MNPLDETTRAYYAQRASIFEEIYEQAERRESVRRLAEHFQARLKGHDVLEVACGTGFWTRRIAQTARSVRATDAVDETLRLARKKRYPEGVVTFQRADAYTLSGISGTFTAGFHFTWWSHIPKARIPEFLAAFHARLKAGALVVFADNYRPDWEDDPVMRERIESKRDGESGDVYSTRRLPNGESYRIVKNWPSQDELRASLEGSVENFRYRRFPYYWVASYTLRTD